MDLTAGFPVVKKEKGGGNPPPFPFGFARN
jgi:hypothetical protein